MLTPERRAELREYATEWLDVSAVNIFPDVLLALLDAADERDRLRAAVRQIADACHWSHDPSGDPEALVAHIGQLQQIAEDAADGRDRLAAQVERVRALHVADGEGFCRCCDYMTPHPCPTLHALDGAGDE